MSRARPVTCHLSANQLARCQHVTRLLRISRYSRWHVFESPALRKTGQGASFLNWTSNRELHPRTTWPVVLVTTSRDPVPQVTPGSYQARREIWVGGRAHPTLSLSLPLSLDIHSASQTTQLHCSSHCTSQQWSCQTPWYTESCSDTPGLFIGPACYQ